jgi:hypothetical protein
MSIPSFYNSYSENDIPVWADRNPDRLPIDSRSDFRAQCFLMIRAIIG